VRTSVVFDTHSITEDNEAGVATGWLPGRLSPRGRELVAFEGAGIPILQDWRLRE